MKHSWLSVTRSALLVLTLGTEALAQSSQSGSANAATVAPAPTPELAPATRRNSTGAMVTGIVLTGVGASFVVMGLVIAQNASSNCGDRSDAQCSDLGPAIGGTVGATLAVSGGIMALVGVPLIIIGSKRVPVDEGQDEPQARSRPRDSLSVSLVMSGSALSLRALF